MQSWKPFLSRVVVGALVVGTAVGAGVFVGVRLAQADPDAPPTRNELTYSGVLRERGSMATTLTFQFYKRGANVCGVTTPSFTPTETGAFTVAVPLGACPDARGLFDGTDVTYNVLFGSEMLASGVQINPVPHARFADQAGVSNDCPAGYVLDASDRPFTVCRRALADGRFDEVVKVGRGGSAFWIDRYEASVWSSYEGAAPQQFQRDGVMDFNAAQFPRNGQWSTAAYAFSVRGVTPSHSITWFQASEACRAAGKQLPTGNEWLTAARGTVDPGDFPGTGGGCNTGDGTPADLPSPLARRNAGGGVNCRSGWGAQDMIGNVWEWTADWFASVGALTSPSAVIEATVPDAGTDAGTTRMTVLGPPATVGQPVAGIRVNSGLEPWDADHGNDGTWNVTSVVYNTSEGRIGIPSAAVRGGAWSSSTRAGVFALDLSDGPSYLSSGVGFRCIVRR